MSIHMCVYTDWEVLGDTTVNSGNTAALTEPMCSRMRPVTRGHMSKYITESQAATGALKQRDWNR